MPNNIYDHSSFLKSEVAKSLLVVNTILVLIYFLAIAFLFPISNQLMFYVLIATEIFHVWQALGFWYTLWDTSYMPKAIVRFTPPVDVFITVAGEPVEIVEETARAAKAMDYPDFRVFLLNDGYVTKKDNWQEIEELARRLKINCITRKVAGGAKAGNINNALRNTRSPFIAVFDADHVPHPDFLKKPCATCMIQKWPLFRPHNFTKIIRLIMLRPELGNSRNYFFLPFCAGRTG